VSELDQQVVSPASDQLIGSCWDRLLLIQSTVS
jgi:hypothetical protein